LRSTAGLERIKASDMVRRNHVSRFVRKRDASSVLTGAQQVPQWLNGRGQT
jgi:hypothetical protein